MTSLEQPDPTRERDAQRRRLTNAGAKHTDRDSPSRGCGIILGADRDVKDIDALRTDTDISTATRERGPAALCDHRVTYTRSKIVLVGWAQTSESLR